MPFIMHVQLHMPPAIILHKFCRRGGAHFVFASAGQLHAAGTLFELHRATRHHHHRGGGRPGMPPCGIEPIAGEPMAPIEPIIERSNIIVLDILNSP